MTNYQGARMTRVAKTWALFAVAVALGLLGPAMTADAATFIVNDLTDAPDANPGDGVAEVIPGSGITTLRAAIEEANQFPGPDSITFSVAGTIDVVALLPALSDTSGGTTITAPNTIDDPAAAVILNGTTINPNDNSTLVADVAFDMASDGNRINGMDINGFNDAIRVTGAKNIVNGTYIDTCADNGIEVSSGLNQILGSYIGNCGTNGIELSGATADSNVLAGNLIGTGGPNGANGIDIVAGARNNLIGGSVDTARNVIVANAMYGIRIMSGGATGNVVKGNYIGVVRDGLGTKPNGADGIVILSGAKNNIVGPTDDDFIAGTVIGARNVIAGNTYDGVAIESPGTTGNLVRGNYIGLDATEGGMIGNMGNGVRIVGGATKNTIGDVAAHNIIAANALYGVRIADSGTTENVLIGNIIGTNSLDDPALGNSGGGVLIIDGAQFNRVGGTGTDEGNVISGNRLHGVTIEGLGTNFNALLGNWIGTTTDGLASLGNASGGVRIVAGAKFNQVGGEPFGSGNVISGNPFRGVEIDGPGTLDNRVQGNFIGTDVTGTVGLNAPSVGVSISKGATNNMVGGAQRRERNIISGNGISGVVIVNTGTTGNRVYNNYIGLDVSGTLPVPNGDSGVVVDFGASSNIIGGSLAGQRNVISANVEDGVQVSGLGTTSNVVQSNYIGTNYLGEVVPGLGNTENGVSLVNSSTTTLVGGTAAGQGNVIAGNTLNGVEVRGAAARANAIRQNSIHDNGLKGILLSGGSNDGLLAPVLTSLNPLSGSAPANAVVEIFLDSADEGETYLASATADAAGNFTTSINALSYMGQYVTATATVTGTSEFSAAVLVDAPIIVTDPVALRVVVDDPATFTVVAAGTPPLNYRWQYWNGVDPNNVVFTNLTDGANITGTTTDTLNILECQTSNQGVYRCVVSNVLGQVESQGAYLEVFPNFQDTAVITTLNDVTDGDTGSLARLVANRGADGLISLREAIIAANNTNAPVTLIIKDTFYTDPANPPVFPITNGALPDISGQGLTLDGRGAVLLGTSLGGSANGLRITSANNVITSLNIGGFPGSGVVIDGAAATGNTIQSAIISANGADGVLVSNGAPDNLLGGRAAGKGLYVAGNGGAGIHFDGANTAGNKAFGNGAGYAVANGVVTVAGNTYGFRISNGASGNNIGGLNPDSGNIIIANTGAGILVEGAATLDNIIQQNRIGVDAGDVAQANGRGIWLRNGVQGTIIGDVDPAGQNIISGNTGTGVVVETTASARNRLTRNKIFANGADGIDVRNLANNGIEPPELTGIAPIAGTAAANAAIELYMDKEDEGETYLDTVTAAADGTFTSAVDITANTDMYVTATATDSQGNSSEFSLAIPIDVTPPVITLLGANPLALECGVSGYLEPGATALDAVDGDISANIVITYTLGDGTPVDSIEPTAAGTLLAHYNVSDRAGNAAVEAVRTINVTDGTAPLITLTGSARMVVTLGQPYTDPGATAFDVCQGDLTANIVTVNPVDVNTAGNYSVTYDVSDAEGNAAVRKVRTVSVLDTVAATITLNGPSVLEAECGVPFVDPGATAIDDIDGDISDQIEVTGTVDVNTFGTYTLYYNVRDTARNPAPTVTRTVIVGDNAGPEITILGGSVLEVQCNLPYNDPGATAVDSCEGDVSSSLTVTNPVDTTIAGEYSVVYRAIDSRGNASTATRTVVVLECNTECVQQCANDENPVDQDGDGLTACVETCLRTSDFNPDSDGDGMPDGYEALNGLNPRVNDADTDIDEDAITNLDEFLDGTNPANRNSPARTFYVATDGVDLLNRGTLDAPFATVTFAVNQLYGTENNPARIVVFGGVYPGNLTLPVNTTLIGALDNDARIEGTIVGANKCALVNLELLGATGDDVLLQMNDAAMKVRNVIFRGTASRPGTGILVSGAKPKDSVIEGCLFSSLNTGIDVLGALPLIRDCAFENLSIAGIMVDSGAQIAGANANGLSTDPTSGWNLFTNTIDGKAVINLAADTLVMEMNDWFFTDAAKIENRLEGPVDYEPFLGESTGNLAAAVYVTIWNATTQERITKANVELLDSGYSVVRKNANGVYAFPLVPGGNYTVRVKAFGYKDATKVFEVAAGQRISVVLPMKAIGKNALFGCQAGILEDSGNWATETVLFALLGGLLLAARARYRRQEKN